MPFPGHCGDDPHGQGSQKHHDEAHSSLVIRLRLMRPGHAQNETLPFWGLAQNSDDGEKAAVTVSLATDVSTSHQVILVRLQNGNGTRIRKVTSMRKWENESGGRI